jgi:hypothetical protein
MGQQPARGHLAYKKTGGSLARASRQEGGLRMATGSGVEEAKSPQPVARSPRRRSAPQEQAPAGSVRFFLAKAGANGTIPSLDREIATEGEAKIESLKTGLNYYSLIEWRATADLAGKNPQVRSEPVKR